MLARSPYIPPSISERRFGTSSARSRNRSWGVPQSSPITATRGPCCIRVPHSDGSRRRARARSRAGRSGGSRILPTARNPPPTCGDGDRVKVLRTFLYAGAAVWAASGLALAIVPRVLILDLFDGAPAQDWALARTLGVAAIGLAMVMVLVAQRLEDVWWWAWAFIITTAGVATVNGLSAALGDREGRAQLLLWLAAAVNAAVCAGLVVGMGRTAQEKPFA